MKTRCFGKIIREFETIDSTSLVAEKILLTGKPCEGSVILAGFQTQGQGAGGNSWHSQAGMNLLTSVILYPEFLHPANQFELNKVISLAVMNCIKSFAPDAAVSIKWPNDIYVDYSKIAGILTKNLILGSTIGQSIAGIGINVNQSSFPTDLPNPVSLRQICGQTFEIESVLKQLLFYFELFYHQLESNEVTQINEQYLRNLLNIHQNAWYQKGNQRFEGTITGVSPFGRLRMLVDNQLNEYDFKEIEFLF